MESYAKCWILKIVENLKSIQKYRVSIELRQKSKCTFMAEKNISQGWKLNMFNFNTKHLWKLKNILWKLEMSMKKKAFIFYIDMLL